MVWSLATCYNNRKPEAFKVFGFATCNISKHWPQAQLLSFLSRFLLVRKKAAKDGPNIRDIANNTGKSVGVPGSWL